MASFIQGIVNRTAQGVDRNTNQIIQKRQTQQNLADEIASSQAMQPQKLAENQAMFEQQQAQQLQAQPQQLQMQETEMNKLAEIKQKLAEAASQIPIQTTPGLREAFAAGDMAKLPTLVQTQGDVEFINTMKRVAREAMTTPEMAYNKAYKSEAGKQQARKEYGVVGRSGSKAGSKAGSKSGSKSSTRLSPQDNDRLKGLNEDLRNAKLYLDVEKAKPVGEKNNQVIDDLELEIRDIKERKRNLFTPLPIGASRKEPMGEPTKQESSATAKPSARPKTVSKSATDFMKTLKDIRNQLAPK